MTAKPSSPALATNRKAKRDYTVLEKITAGIALRGTEVKSIRDRQVSLDESFAQIRDGECILEQMHIQPYRHGNVHNHPAVRPRPLLLHKAEIHRLYGKLSEKGLTLIPLRLVTKGPHIKVELGLCRGKQTHDKREDLKRKTADAEARRAMARRR